VSRRSDAWGRKCSPSWLYVAAAFIQMQEPPVPTEWGGGRCYVATRADLQVWREDELLGPAKLAAVSVLSAVGVSTAVCQMSLGVLCPCGVPDVPWRTVSLRCARCPSVCCVLGEQAVRAGLQTAVFFQPEEYS
jgi:hypothetical protein